MTPMDGKKINVFSDDNFHIAVLRCPYQENGIVKFKDLNFRYSLFLDCDFNMYFIPAKAAVDPATNKPIINPKTGKMSFVDAYKPEDVVKAAMGDAQAKQLLEDCREQIKQAFNKDVMSEDNMNALYRVTSRNGMMQSYNTAMREAGFAEVPDDKFPQTIKTPENFTREELESVVKNAENV